MQEVSQSGIGGRQTIGWQIYFIRQRRRWWKVVHTAPSNAISENFWKCQIAPRGDRQWQLRWWFRLGRSLIFHRKQLKAEIIRKTIRTGIAVWWWSQSNRQIGVKKDKQQNVHAIFVSDFVQGCPNLSGSLRVIFDSFLNGQIGVKKDKKQIAWWAFCDFDKGRFGIQERVPL